MCLKGGGGGGRAVGKREGRERGQGPFLAQRVFLKIHYLGLLVVAEYLFAQIRHENKRFWLSIVLGQYCISHGIASLIITSVVLMRLGERQKKKKQEKTVLGGEGKAHLMESRLVCPGTRP